MPEAYEDCGSPVRNDGVGRRGERQGRRNHNPRRHLIPALNLLPVRNLIPVRNPCLRHCGPRPAIFISFLHGAGRHRYPPNHEKRKAFFMVENAYVYIMTNATNSVLYIGITTNFQRRVWNHKNNTDPDAFTARHACHKLVYFEHTTSIKAAIMREKQLKNWRRDWKDELIGKRNPRWLDLSNW